MADLGKVMVTPKGVYSANKSYERLDLVTYNGSSYIALKGVSGINPSNDGENWQLHGQGYPGDANGVDAIDTQGLVVGADDTTDVQALIDAIAQKVVNEFMYKADVVSQITNDATKAASMAALYGVKQELDATNSNSNNSITSDYFDFSIYQKGAVKCINDRGYALQTKMAMSANTAYELYTLSDDVMKPIIRFDKYVVLRDGIVAQLLIETTGKISIIPMADIPTGTYIRFAEIYI